MCDAATQSILESIVKGKVQSNEMFTALDISREAQKNHHVQYRHNDLKNDVHRIYADGEMQFDNNGQVEQYDRTLIAIPGIKGKVWLYHAAGADVSLYRSKYAPQPYTGPTSAVPQPNPHQSIIVPPLIAKPVPVTASPLPVTPPTTTGPKTASGLSHKAKAANSKSDFVSDARDRLWIPKAVIEKLGVPSGSRVDVIKEGQSLILSPSNGVVSPDKVTDYKVDRKGMIALSAMCFRDAGITGHEFDVVEINGKVVVKGA